MRTNCEAAVARLCKLAHTMSYENERSLTCTRFEGSAAASAFVTELQRGPPSRSTLCVRNSAVVT